MTLVSINDICLQQLSIHLEELQEEVFVKGKGNLALADFVYHHECDLVFLVIVAVVDHVHIHNVVLCHDVVSVRVVLN